MVGPAGGISIPVNCNGGAENTQERAREETIHKPRYFRQSGWEFLPQPLRRKNGGLVRLPVHTFWK
jgi:hypothetical protein